LFPFGKPWFPKFCEAKLLQNLRETIKRAALAWKEKNQQLKPIFVLSFLSIFLICCTIVFIDIIFLLGGTRIRTGE